MDLKESSPQTEGQRSSPAVSTMLHSLPALSTGWSGISAVCTLDFQLRKVNYQIAQRLRLANRFLTLIGHCEVTYGTNSITVNRRSPTAPRAHAMAGNTRVHAVTPSTGIATAAQPPAMLGHQLGTLVGDLMPARIQERGTGRMSRCQSHHGQRGFWGRGSEPDGRGDLQSCLKSGSQPGAAHTSGTPRAVHRLIGLLGKGVVCGMIHCHPAPFSDGAGDLSSTGDPSAARAVAGASTAAPSHSSWLQMLNPSEIIILQLFCVFNKSANGSSADRGYQWVPPDRRERLG